MALCLLLLVTMTLFLTPGYSATTDEMALQQLFENALTSNPSNLAELGEKFPVGTVPSVACAAVQYTIQCISQCWNDSDHFNCTSPTGYSVAFLWTPFQTMKFPGNALIFWLVGGVRVLGFDWDNSCKFHLDTDDAITLLLSDIAFPCISDAERATQNALESITLRLKSYTESENEKNSNYSQYSKSGYARKWKESDVKAHLSGAVGVRVGVVVISILFTLVFGPQLLFKIYKEMEKKELVHFFWSFHTLAFFWSWLGLEITVFLGTLKEDAHIYGTMYAVINAGYLVLSIIIRCRNGNAKWCPELPSTHCSKFANIFALHCTFCLLTYLLYSLPSIALSYYAFPSRTLIRLAYFEFAVICLLVVVALLLYTGEDCYKQFCGKYNQVSGASMTPNHSQNTELSFLPSKRSTSVSTSVSQSSEQSQQHRYPDVHVQGITSNLGPSITQPQNTERSPLLGASRQTRSSEQSQQDPEQQTPVVDQDELCCTSGSVVCTGLKVFTVLLFLVFTSALLVIAGGIVFTSTSNESETDILAIVPTIVANGIIFLTKWTNFKIPEAVTKEQQNAAERLKKLRKKE